MFDSVEAGLHALRMNEPNVRREAALFLAGHPSQAALESLLSSGKLPSRRQHRTDPNKSALQTIMGEVDDLSRDHER